MGKRLRSALLAAGATTAAMIGLATAPAADAAPASPAGEVRAQDYTLWGSYYTAQDCSNVGWAGYSQGLWGADWLCQYSGGYWRLYVNILWG